MAWQDDYVPGSFRGVPFVTVSHDHDFGRRGDAHEFPFRDEPYFEDLGRKAEGWSFRAFVIGPDYMVARDALLTALRLSGPGTLVHPYLGTFQAQFVDGRLSESTEEGGMARFDLQFVEPGIVATALAKADTRTLAYRSSDEANADASDRFADEFDAAGEPPFVQDAAAGQIRDFAHATAIISGLVGGSGPRLRSFQAGLSVLAGAASLLGAPANLAAVVLGLVGDLSQLGGRRSAQMVAMRQVIDRQAARPSVMPTTPSRLRQARNDQAIADLIVVGAAAAMVRSVADSRFGSYDDAVDCRDDVGDILDDQAIAAADRGNTALAASLDQLRRTMIADVTARGGSLARLFAYSPQLVSPAVVHAWTLYRDPTSTLGQAAELVERNGIRHPGFVPVAQLQVPTAKGAADV